MSFDNRQQTRNRWTCTFRDVLLENPMHSIQIVCTQSITIAEASPGTLAFDTLFAEPTVWAEIRRGVTLVTCWFRQPAGWHIYEGIVVMIDLKWQLPINDVFLFLSKQSYINHTFWTLYPIYGKLYLVRIVPLRISFDGLNNVYLQLCETKSTLNLFSTCSKKKKHINS